jgi:hypothetical protein
LPSSLPQSDNQNLDDAILAGDLDEMMAELTPLLRSDDDGERHSDSNANFVLENDQEERPTHSGGLQSKETEERGDEECDGSTTDSASEDEEYCIYLATL